MKLNTETYLLNNNYKLPKIGYGTYRITDEQQGINAIKHAINFGYKMIDTADFYKNHHLIAKAIELSDFKREDLFLTSKIWPSKSDKEEIRNDIKRVLKELNTYYLDLLIVHWPVPYGDIVYSVLEEFYEKGILKSIGVSNYNVNQLKNLISNCKIKPMVNQIELHPNAIRQDVLEFCKKENIIVTSWQTIMEGKVDQLKHIKSLADKYEVDSASIALKWALQKGINIIPKSVTNSRIESNILNLEKFNLTDKEIILIDKSSTEDGMKINSEEFDASKK